MLKFYLHKDIDLNKWNHSINNSLDADIFHTYWFLNIATNNKWDAIISDNYDILIPLPYKLTLRRKHIDTPDLIPYSGPLHAKIISTLNENIQQEFIDLLKANKLKLKKFRTLSSNFKNLNPALKSFFVTDLIYPYDRLYDNYQPDIKEIIQKADNLKLHFNSKIKIEGAIEFLYDNNTYQRLDNYEKIKNICKIAQNKKQLKILGLYNSRMELLALGIFLIFKNKISFLSFGYKSSDQTFKPDHLYLLISNEIIKTFSANNYIFRIFPWLFPNINPSGLKELNFYKQSVFDTSLSR